MKDKYLFFTILIINYIINALVINPLFCESLNVTYCYGKNESGELAQKKAIREAIKSTNVFVSSVSTVKNGQFHSEIIDLITCAYLTNFQIKKITGNSDKNCYSLTADVSKKYDTAELLSFINTKLEANIKDLIDRSVKKILPKYLSEKELEYISKSKEYFKNIDIEEIAMKILQQSSFIEKLNNMKGYTKNIDTLIENIYHMKTIWGFRVGEFHFADSNIHIKSCLIAFFNYLDDKLSPMLKGKKVEILVIGYADEIPVNKNGLLYNFNQIPYISDVEGCPNYKKKYPNYYPAQPIYLLPDGSLRWQQVDNRNQTLQKKFIQNNVRNNCQLSFLRGYFVMLYLKEFTKMLDSLKIDYSYSGKGVDYSNLSKYKKRKVTLILRQSRLNI